MTDTQDQLLPAADAAQTAGYRVLARKYRPARFADLIGQDALVRTLTNAIKLDRIAQAWVLTGVRGVGKTTTARIIARALNCVGSDGKGGPTAEPCGVCENCRAIAEDRHVDVIEMDAASRTGVDDVRDLIDGVRYKPMSARYKVYIVDEVHMLSRQAFNALLKTLEEPPAHVKFVFATTEIRKVPVTVLSRCQRFDLRRVDQATLAPHLARIAQAEGATLSAEAIALLARAADGSVRDGLSLLDQAIATFSGKGAVDAAAIREMMGLADRTHIFDLFEAALGGRAAEALDRFAQACHGGADPIVLLNDLLDLVHWTTRVKLAPEAADDPAIPEAERVRGRAAAQALSMASLTRAWQILLKGLGEAQGAPDPGQAAEMALVRLAYAAELPTPADLVQRLQKEAPRDSSESPGSPGPSGPAPSGNGGAEAVGRSAPAPRGASPRGPQATALAPQNEIAVRQPAPERPNPKTFAEAVQLFADKKEAILHAHLLGDVHLVRFEAGRLEFRLGPRAPRDLPNRVQKLLSDWTGRQWGVSLSREAGADSLVEQASAAEQARRADAAANPLVKAVLETFPGAEITAVRDLDVGGADEAPLPVEQDSEDA